MPPSLQNRRSDASAHRAWSGIPRGLARRAGDAREGFPGLLQFHQAELALERKEMAMPLHLWVLDPPPEPRNRLTCAIRLLMVIPQAFVLLFVNIAAFFAIIAAWFVALVTGRVSPGLREFLVGVVRWNIRVGAYFFFLTDTYPPYSLEEDESYPVRLAFPPDEELNRLAVLFRLFIVIPAYIVSSVLIGGLWVVSIGSWFMLLVTGQLPRPLFEAARIVMRYQERLYGYFSMLTSEYPWGPMGDAVSLDTTDDWSIRLSDSGRTAMVVVIVIGIIVDIVNYSSRGRP
jgi:hypothetical protein